MEHKELKRIVERSKRAVLFVHGIVGTPNHFADFVRLVPDEISVYNLLLDGHGGSVKDFSNTSIKKWEAQIDRAAAELSSTHEEIYIAAHSMGTLFAIEQAIKNPKVAKLFLLAVPVKLFLKPPMLLNSLKVYFDRIKPGDRVALAAKRCYGIGASKNVFDYFGWIPRYLELFAKIRDVRKILHSLNTPCEVFLSRKDEMVSIRSGRYFSGNTAVTVTELRHSMHYYYDRNDYAMLLESFGNWIGGLSCLEI